MKERLMNAARRVKNWIVALWRPQALVHAYRWVMNRLIAVWHRHHLKIVITGLLVCLFVAYFWNDMVISIHSGERGIKWHRFSGTDLEHFYGEGLHVQWPWDIMYIYSLRVQEVNDSLQILTSEGVTIAAYFSYRYYPDEDSVAVLHRTLGPDYGESYVRPEVRGATMAIIGDSKLERLHKMSTLVIQSTIKSYLFKQLDPMSIVLEDFLLTRLVLPPLISTAIERKMAAEQLALEYDFRLLTEEKEKRRKSIEAQGIQDFERISNISILKWKAIEATADIAKSNNSKVIIIGTGKDSFPIMLNTDSK